MHYINKKVFFVKTQDFQRVDLTLNINLKCSTIGACLVLHITGIISFNMVLPCSRSQAQITSIIIIIINTKRGNAVCYQKDKMTVNVEYQYEKVLEGVI